MEDFPPFNIRRNGSPFAKRETERPDMGGKCSDCGYSKSETVEVLKGVRDALKSTIGLAEREIARYPRDKHAIGVRHDAQKQLTAINALIEEEE